jgi:hypothetical protein
MAFYTLLLLGNIICINKYRRRGKKISTEMNNHNGGKRMPVSVPVLFFYLAKIISIIAELTFLLPVFPFYPFLII